MSRKGVENSDCDLEHDQAAAVAAYAAGLSPDQMAAARTELAGHDLACWCRTGPCHVDILLAVANDIHPKLDRP